MNKEELRKILDTQGFETWVLNVVIKNPGNDRDAISISGWKEGLSLKEISQYILEMLNAEIKSVLNCAAEGKREELIERMHGQILDMLHSQGAYTAEKDVYIGEKIKR